MQLDCRHFESEISFIRLVKPRFSCFIAHSLANQLPLNGDNSREGTAARRTRSNCVDASVTVLSELGGIFALKEEQTTAVEHSGIFFALLLTQEFS